MPKERVKRKVLGCRNSADNTTSSKTATSEADKIAARLRTSKTKSVKAASSMQREQKELSIEAGVSGSQLPQPKVVIDVEKSRESSHISEPTGDAIYNDVEEDNINTLRSVEKVSVDTSDKTFYLQIIEGLRRSMNQNKELYEAIHKIKTSQGTFQKEVVEKLDILSEKVNQLITPEDSYWKNLASKTCKVQLPLLGLYPDDSEFKKGFEITVDPLYSHTLRDRKKMANVNVLIGGDVIITGVTIKGVDCILEQEKPGYIEQLGAQWVHFYSGRVCPLCHDIIKSRRCDKAKDVRAAMFDVFGEKHLTWINTSAKAEDIATFKKSDKTKKAFKCLFQADDDKSLPYVEAIKKKAWGNKKRTTMMDTAFTLAVCEVVLNPRHPRISVNDNALHKRFDTYWDYMRNFKEITSSTTKHIVQEELGSLDDYTSESNDDFDDDQENDDEADKQRENNDINQW